MSASPALAPAPAALSALVFVRDGRVSAVHRAPVAALPSDRTRCGRLLGLRQRVVLDTLGAWERVGWEHASAGHCARCARG